MSAVDETVDEPLGGPDPAAPGPMAFHQPSDHDDDFRLVRKHAAELGGWFADQTGWRLTVDAETARLFKKPAALDDSTRPARAPKTKVPFTRRRYVLLCLALAVLERSESQTTLGRLAEGVLTGAADPALTEAGITFAMERREERADLVAVVRLLLSWGPR